MSWIYFLMVTLLPILILIFVKKPLVKRSLIVIIYLANLILCALFLEKIVGTDGMMPIKAITYITSSLFFIVAFVWLYSLIK